MDNLPKIIAVVAGIFSIVASIIAALEFFGISATSRDETEQVQLIGDQIKLDEDDFDARLRAIASHAISRGFNNLNLGNIRVNVVSTVDLGNLFRPSEEYNQVVPKHPSSGLSTTPLQAPFEFPTTDFQLENATKHRAAIISSCLIERSIAISEQAPTAFEACIHQEYLQKDHYIFIWGYSTRRLKEEISFSIRQRGDIRWAHAYSTVLRSNTTDIFTIIAIFAVLVFIFLAILDWLRFI